ncbi:MAG: AI-2E family transporter [Nanoarchaeota archaeon]
MAFSHEDFKKAVVILLLVLLAFLTFFIVKPIVISIFGGLLLAYIFRPFYLIVNRKIKYRNISAAIISVIVILILIVPLWFLAPILIQKVFDLFESFQSLDIFKVLKVILPNISDPVINQINIALKTATSNFSAFVLNSLVDFVVNFSNFLLHLIIVAFVFFFALRDGDKLGEFVSGLSPLNKTQERNIVKQFGGITQSIIYGQVFAGIVQGILAGLGFFIFKVPNALVLTILAIISSIIPFVGPGLVYLPVGVYLMFSAANPITGIVFLLYNLLIVSTLDNFIRLQFISRKTQLPQVFVLIGMVGGTLLFGILGLILGPLILAYFIILLKAYKDKTLSSLFVED